MSSDAPDLAQLIQRRELTAYEQRMARVAYAYGVDLRRSHWLDDSTLGEPILRTVDRRWGDLIAELDEDVFEAPDSLPGWLLDELASAAALLRAPLPTVRTIRPSAREADPWPVITPLGTTKGAMQWLVVDLPALTALDAPVRRFVLAACIAHLQCEHGPLFTAHFMARNSRWVMRLARRMLAPWTRVAVFSADRAGLLATTNLDGALRGIRSQLPSALVRWWPSFPDVVAREQALRDFERSAVVARMRRLRDRGSIIEMPNKAGDGTSPDETSADEPPDASSSTADSEAPADGAGTAAPGAPTYWSLARCDERLTRRLGLF